MFYIYAADITYITESGRKKNKQEWTWVSSKRKKGDVFDTFLALLCICGYRERVSERNSHTIIRNADWSSRAGRPGLWVHKSKLHLQQFPRRLSLTAANSSLFTALGTCLSSSSSGLVGNLARKPFVWVSRQNRQRNPLTGAYPHPHPQPQNVCPPLCFSIICVKFRLEKGLISCKANKPIQIN